uniref:HTH_Tnp_Tc3_1 domain-containing protein n=1 Tax=Strongyloides papillosus TaxID=174720 RepID=A0A0N5BY67_STREA
MPKRTKLTEFEKGQILAFASVGKTHSEISTLVNRSRKVISTILKDASSYGTAKHTGRPSNLSVRDKRAISRSASNTTKSCTSIRNELNLPVSRWIVNRALTNDQNIVRSKMAKCSRLDKSHKVARLEYARKYMTWSEEWT